MTNPEGDEIKENNKETQTLVRRKLLKLKSPKSVLRILRLLGLFLPEQLKENFLTF